MFRIDDDSQRVTPVTLHNVAGPDSPVVSLQQGGAVVVGGSAYDSREATVVATDGSTRTVTLQVARVAAQGVAAGEDVLVFGGDTAGTAELIDVSAGTSWLLSFTDAPPRHVSGALIASPDGAQALLVGGRSDPVTARTDTVLITGCPDCVATAGPTWSNARTGFTVADQWIIGGDNPLVERFDFDNMRFVQAGSLEVSRGEPAAIALPSGVVIVLGGRDGGDIALSSVEFCFPPALASL